MNNASSIGGLDPSSPRPAPARPIERHVTVALVLWLSAAVLLTLATQLAARGRHFDFNESAHAAMTAHAFLEHGIAALRGVPIRNHSPLGREPDVYIHWPPLFPITLSLAFRVFGESEATAHTLMLVVLLASALALYALVRACGGHLAGLVAAFALLLMPVTLAYGAQVWRLPPAILAMVVALLAFVRATAGTQVHRGWAAVGVATFVLAAWTSWEPLLAGAGLLGTALRRRRRAELTVALLYCGAGTLAFVAVMILYLSTSPHLLGEIWSTLLYRAGLAPYAPGRLGVHTLVHQQEYTKIPHLGLLEVLRTFASRSEEMVGQLGIVALGWLLLRLWSGRHRGLDERVTVVLAGLLAPWVLWSAIMWNFAFAHPFHMALAVPAVATALGLGAAGLIDVAARVRDRAARRALHSLLLIVLPLVMLLPVNRGGILTWVPPRQREHWTIAYARQIKAATEPGAVVLSPTLAEEAPVYYSERHVIRGVVNDALVDEVVPRLSEVFPGAPVYLALRPGSLEGFPSAVRRYPVLKQSEHLVLLAVPATSTPSVR